MSALRSPRLAAGALAVAALASLLGVVPATAARAASSPGLLACNGRVVHEPTSFVVTCADANTVLTHLVWSAWGATSATATATFGENPCTPDCADSAIRYYPHATVRLSRAVRTSRGILFSDLSVRYVRSGTSRSFTFTWKGDPAFHEMRAASHRASS